MCRPPCLRQERAHQSFEAKRCAHAHTSPSATHLLPESWVVGFVVVLIVISMIVVRKIERRAMQRHRHSSSFSPWGSGHIGYSRQSTEVALTPSKSETASGRWFRASHTVNQSDSLAPCAATNDSGASDVSSSNPAVLADVVLMADKLPPPRRGRQSTQPPVKPAAPSQQLPPVVELPISQLPTTLLPPMPQPAPQQRVQRTKGGIGVAWRALLNGELVI